MNNDFEWHVHKLYLVKSNFTKMYVSLLLYKLLLITWILFSHDYGFVSNQCSSLSVKVFSEATFVYWKMIWHLSILDHLNIYLFRLTFCVSLCAVFSSSFFFIPWRWDDHWVNHGVWGSIIEMCYNINKAKKKKKKQANQSLSESSVFSMQLS